MIILAVLLTEVIFVAVNEGIFPMPFDARPMEVLLFVQTKLVPATVPFNTISLVFEPLQKY